MTQSSVLGHRTGFGRVVVVLLSIVALVLGLNHPVANAQAGQQANVTFSNQKLSARAGEDNQIYKWEYLDFTFDWSLPQAMQYKPGDYFEIQIPQQLGLSYQQSFPLLTEDGAEGAHCELPTKLTNGKRTLTCTFRNADALDGKYEIHGTAKLSLQAQQAYDKSSLDFDFNDIPVSLEIPGGKIHETNVGHDLNKHGWYTNNGNEIRWNAVIPGPALAARPNAPVTIRDVLWAGPNATSPHRHIGKCGVATYVIGQPNTSIITSGPKLPSVDCNINADDTKMDITVNPPADGWSAEHVYYVAFSTEPIDPSTAVTDALTGNYMKVTQEGYDIGEDDGTVYRRAYGSGTISGVDRGSFAIMKKLADDSAPVDPNKEYTFEASYMLNGEAKTETLSVKADGQAKAGEVVLPIDTEVTLREVKPTADGVTFEEPVFTVTSGDDVQTGTDDKGAFVKFKTKGASNVAFTVTNKAVSNSGGLQITKKVGGISGFLFERGREFNFTATIDEAGTIRTENFTLKNDETKSFDDLPVGTKVTIKEELPGNNIFSEWKTPSFTSTDDNVVDNGDGSVTITVTDNDDTTVTKVDVNNSANPPLWWLLLLLIPLLPLIPLPQLPGVPGPAPAPAPAPSEPAQPTKGVQKGMPRN